MSADILSERIKLLLPYEEKRFAASLSTGQKKDWGYSLINPEAIYSKTKGKDINVCIIDTGIAKSHPDLAGNIKKTFNPYEKEWPEDRVGHGTHVAGIVGALDNSIGVIGIAPECNLFIAKGLDDNGFGDWEKIAACIQWAVKEGAHIINMSLGDPNEPPEIVHNAIKFAASKGVIVVAAAGNDPNSKPSKPTVKDLAYPARYEEVIAVAALDKKGNLAYFSHRGKLLSAIAPGVEIYSCYPPKNYALLSGTSQAAPMISGVLALLKASYPSEINNYKDAIAKLQDISKDNIVASAGRDLRIGVPKFANVSVQSIGEELNCYLDEETMENFEDFDWKWKGKKFISENLGVYDE
jgi:subtilisin family serine protease